MDSLAPDREQALVTFAELIERAEGRVLPDGYRVELSNEDKFGAQRFPEGYRVELIERG